MPGPLERDDIIDGLREIARRTREAGMGHAEIRIVGGAALRLLYFERPSTVDIDAYLSPVSELESLARAIASERNWPADWLNDKARQFIPGWGREVEWTLVHEEPSVTICVASVETLLAMKLHALGGRAGRDADDVAKLLRLTSIGTVDEAEALYEEFYPGDAFSAKTAATIERIFEIGLPDLADSPTAPHF